MGHIKEDRRSLRSKKLILNAMRELLLEKDHKAITISDIVKRADIARATFYAHFEDKNALQQYMYQLLIGQIEMEVEAILASGDSATDHNQILVPSFALFRIAADKHRWFKHNAETPEIGLSSLIPPLVIRLEAKAHELNIPSSEGDIPRHIIATYLISSLVALLTNWVITDMTEPPEAMDAMYQSLAEPTIKRLLNEA